MEVVFLFLFFTKK